MSHLDQLRATTTIHDLSHLLGYTAKGLAYVLYGRSPSSNYTNFTIPKKSGGVREINAPISELKLIQKRLAMLLQDCIHDINKKRKIKSVLSHGFRRDCSIITNALEHKNKKYVFNIDLADFFGTINFGRVRGFFIKNENFKLEPAIATIIAQIACYENSLPQGSPCSPVISNLIGHTLDIRLARLANQYSCHYSRYADDITFSTNLREFPSQIARTDGADEHLYIPGAKLAKAIRRSGFTINPDKTRLQYKNSRQDVTGLTVNKKVNTRSVYWRTVRSMAHRLFNAGEFDIVSHVEDEDGNLSEVKEKGTPNQLHGMLSFIHHVDWESRSDVNPHDHDIAHSSREKLFRKFLFYRYFYAHPMPVVLCEGKTDNIYIRCAIQELFKSYPKLVENDSGKLKLLVSLFKYTKNNSRLLRLGGGAPHLKKFISGYKKHYGDYKAPRPECPVIVLIDNDSESKTIFSTVSQALGGVKVDGTKPYYHIVHNLYLCPIPKVTGAGDTVIEDYFEAKVLATELSGKKFNKSNGKFDKEKEYGKQLFAEHVVKKNKGTINFKNFAPVLDGIQAAIDHYKAMPV